MKKQVWDGRMNRQDRMRATWLDMLKAGQTKLPFAVFEKRMLERDFQKKKADYIKNSITLKYGSVVEKAIKKMLA